MKTQFDINEFQQSMIESIPFEIKVDTLYDIVQKILDQNTIRARVVKYKLQKFIKSDDPYPFE